MAPAATTVITYTVFLLVGVIGVTGTEFVTDFKVVPGFLVLVPD